MSLLRIGLLFACALIAVPFGCSQGADLATPTAAIEDTHPSTPGPLVVAGQWHLDLTKGQATLVQTRTADTLRQQNLFHLDPAAFFEEDDLEIRGSTVLPNGDVRFDYAIRHPFPAPDFTQPPSAQNRADLGITGQLLILADVRETGVPGRRFYTTVVANTDAIVDPDGFLEPGDLLAQNPAEFATAFPFKLIVDELRNNREGVSNGSAVRGNYNRFAGGWQRDTIGHAAGNVGWTGYDFLHQGQTALGSFTVSKYTVENTPEGLELALLIKWQDPKGVRPSGNPSVFFPHNAPYDPHKFAYRLPYAALDVSQVAVSPALNGNLSTLPGSEGRIGLAVRDWDAAGPETDEANLGDESDVGATQQGSASKPEVTAHFPRLSNTPFGSEATNIATGIPTNPLGFDLLLKNVKGTSAAGPNLGLVRVSDQETLLDRSSYTFGVDPVTLLADAARAPGLVTYQRCVINLPSQIADSLPPTFTNMAPNTDDYGYNFPSGNPASGVNGSMVYVVQAGAKGADSGVFINVSGDGGRTWTGPQLIPFAKTFPQGSFCVLGNGNLLYAELVGNDFTPAGLVLHLGETGPEGIVDWIDSTPVSSLAYSLQWCMLKADPVNPAKAHLMVLDVAHHNEDPVTRDLRLHEAIDGGGTVSVSNWSTAAHPLGEFRHTTEYVSTDFAVGYDGGICVVLNFAGGLRFTYRAPGQAEFPQQLDWLGFIKYYDSVAVMIPRSGIPCVVFTSNGQKFISVRNNPGPSPWSTGTFQYFTYVAIDPETGNFYLAWEEGGNLMYMVSPPNVGTPLLAPTNINPHDGEGPPPNLDDIIFTRVNGVPHCTLITRGTGAPGNYSSGAICIDGGG